MDNIQVTFRQPLNLCFLLLVFIALLAKVKGILKESSVRHITISFNLCSMVSQNKPFRFY
jgi:hypothetical protein